jgi:phosphatidylserine/phosphatidylglycerophosphate/cardiolipin synthase-like enzyme
MPVVGSRLRGDRGTVALLLAATALASACRVAAPAAAEDDDAAAAATNGSGGAGSGGAGSGGEDPPACDAYDPRPNVPEVLIGPTGLQNALTGLMDAAQSEIALSMYQLGSSGCVDGLIRAHQRGVVVRVQIDANQTVNDNPRSELEGAGIEVRSAPSEFSHAHSKVMIVDDAFAVVMSANMNVYSMSSERNYGVINRDAQDVADLGAIFERDWAGQGTVDLSCTRLIVSPENARQRLVSFVEGAEASLDLAVMYVSDSEVLAAVKARAQAGVPVRVLLANPEWIDSNPETATELSAAGIETRYLYEYELHAKLVVADGVPFVGSENMSFNSLENNREVGLFVTESEPAAAIVSQFETDWAAGVTAP